MHLDELLQLLNHTLQIGDRISQFHTSTPLIGQPEFDSMAIIAILSELESKYELVVQDEEINEDIFESVGSLLEFINHKLGHPQGQ